jgi:RNA polymerase sigma-70 factor (ECF subfamily)
MRGLGIEAAEDIVQDVFMRLMENHANLASVESPRAYLWCIVRNALTDFLRRRGREHAVFVNPPGDAEGEDPAADEWLDRLLVVDGRENERLDHLECVARALERFRRVEPDKAAAIDIVAVEGFEGREFADAIGKTYGAAREFLSQARKALRMLVQTMCDGLFV